MKENDHHDHESSSHHSHSHIIKKKCKKKRSPMDEDNGRRKTHRSFEDSESRKREAKGDRKDFDEAESRRKGSRKEKEYEEVDCRRKDGRERDRHSDSPTRRRIKHRERRSVERKRDLDVKLKIKEESQSEDELPQRNRSRSPRDRHREDRKRSNLDAMINVKEEKHEWGKGDDKKKKPMENKAKPDFGLSGKLAEETNIVNGVVIKYSEPEEARKPKVRWRFYPFKGDSSLPVLHLHRQSAYLIGRDRKIADLPVDHPSCSKQHAVLQYRLVPYTRPNGSQGKRVRPYIIDLESANGTFVNNNKIEAKKYVELIERDVIKFAFSSREYVLLHEHSKDAYLDDDVQ